MIQLCWKNLDSSHIPYALVSLDIFLAVVQSFPQRMFFFCWLLLLLILSYAPPSIYFSKKHTSIVFFSTKQTAYSISHFYYIDKYFPFFSSFLLIRIDQYWHSVFHRKASPCLVWIWSISRWHPFSFSSRCSYTSLQSFPSAEILLFLFIFLRFDSNKRIASVKTTSIKEEKNRSFSLPVTTQNKHTIDQKENFWKVFEKVKKIKRNTTTCFFLLCIALLLSVSVDHLNKRMSIFQDLGKKMFGQASGLVSRSEGGRDYFASATNMVNTMVKGKTPR